MRAMSKKSTAVSAKPTQKITIELPQALYLEAHDIRTGRMRGASSIPTLGDVWEEAIRIGLADIRRRERGAEKAS